MNLLTFKLKHADKKWPIYLSETFGEELASKFKIESVGTAKTTEATINLFGFNGDKKIINTIKNDKNVISAYIVSDNTAKTVIVP